MYSPGGGMDSSCWASYASNTSYMPGEPKNT